MPEPATPLAADDVVVRNDAGLLTTEVDGELIGMSIDQGVCYGLNGVGSRIWTLIAEPRSVESLCADLVREFDVEAELCRRDVVALLESLRAEGLVTVRNP